MKITGTASELITKLLAIFKEDPDKKWRLEEYHEKRSRSQNAYYWAIEAQMADAMKLGKAEMHNRLLRQYGYPEIFGGKVARALLPDTDETEEKALKSTTIHMKPISQTTMLADGIRYRTYQLMRGSSDLDSKEMAHFLDMVEQDARALGIDTATPDERRRMYELQKQAEQRDRHTDKGEKGGRES